MDSLKPEDVRIALLSGGASAEREISLASARAAGAALRSVGFSVTDFDPSRKEDLCKLIEGDFDVAFPCLHGKWGEDGTLQGLFEVINLPYVGAGVWSSAMAIDKSKAKVFYERAGLTTPKSVTLHRQDGIDVARIIEEVGESCVVKPGTEGSALGVFIVQGAEEIEDAITKAFEFDSVILVETFVSGTELTVAVIGNGEDAQALPVIQIVPKNEFYDFESKYAPGGSQHLCPAPISEEATAKAQQIAVAAHRALECSDVSRSDIIMDQDGECWILETNTIPGMTETSLLPDAARAAGIEFAELLTRFIWMALDRAKK